MDSDFAFRREKMDDHDAPLEQGPRPLRACSWRFRGAPARKLFQRVEPNTEDRSYLESRLTAKAWE